MGPERTPQAQTGMLPLQASSATDSSMSALDILRQRDARGEIDAATYEDMRNRLKA